MRILLTTMVFGVALLGNGLAANDAYARPLGWKCDYTQSYNLFDLRERQVRNYACYGRNLRETKARARRACRRLSNCLPGPCFPLQSRTSHYCSREP